MPFFGRYLYFRNQYCKKHEFSVGVLLPGGAICVYEDMPFSPPPQMNASDIRFPPCLSALRMSRQGNLLMYAESLFLYPFFRPEPSIHLGEDCLHGSAVRHFR